MALETPAHLARHPFDPLDPGVLSDPYPFYAWLRDHDPVHWGAPGEPQAAGCWYITRYDDAVAVLKDPRFGREVTPLPEAPASSMVDPAREWMVLRDPPAHTYLRSLVQRSFTPQMIERWTPRFRALAHAQADGVTGRSDFDLLHDVVAVYPVLVVAELLGVPPEDAPLFTPWTRALAALIEFEQSPAVIAAGHTAMTELADYLRTIIAARRRAPQDDLISALLALDQETPIPEETLVGTCTQLLFGGNDPVAHLVSNGMLALLQRPQMLAALRSRADVPPAAVDELMRYDSSVQMTFRYALENLAFGGKTLQRGDLVAVVFGAANRDPRQFDRPDELDLARTPNRHLSLGQGIHYCMGAALARTTGAVMMETLLHRLPPFHLAEEALRRQRTVAVRGLARLPVTCAA